MGKQLHHKEFFQEASGSLQTCTGLKSGIEAAVQAIRETFHKDDSEAALLVDAENITVPNILSISSESVPETFQVVLGRWFINYVSGRCNSKGNVTMPMYALGSRPLIDLLATEVQNAVPLMTQQHAVHLK